MDEDTKQRIQGGLTFIIEFYKICMGTFLTVFVPHQCKDEKICTVSYNINGNDDPYHKSVFVFNIVSFVVFFSMYFIEVKRENWCINYLDTDYSRPADNLDEEIEYYPIFKFQMNALNRKYKILVDSCIGFQTINIVLSSIDISNNWAGSASLAPMLSYILLIFIKLFHTRTIATTSLYKERAYSAYLSGPKTFNVIDKDHRLPEPNSIISHEEIESNLQQTNNNGGDSIKQNETAPSNMNSTTLLSVY